MTISESDHTLSPELASRVSAIIASAWTASLATVGNDGPSVCAVFYVYMGDGKFGFKSRRSSEHMKNLSTQSNASLLVFNPDSTYAAKFGVQMRGQVRECTDVNEMAQVINLYSDRFEGAGKKLTAPETMLLPSTESTFFIFQAARLKLVDESPEANRTMSDYASFPDI